MSTYLARFIEAYRFADESQLALGRSWYSDARTTARAIARETGRTLHTVAGVIAALSPRAHWKTNVAWAAQSCRTGRAVGGLKMCVRKAQAILSGLSPLKALQGNKVRAFYRALVGDTMAAVVDIWIGRAAGLDDDSDIKREYGSIARALVLGAAFVGVSVTDFQATVWVVTRGYHD